MTKRPWNSWGTRASTGMNRSMSMVRWRWVWYGLLVHENERTPSTESAIACSTAAGATPPRLRAAAQPLDQREQLLGVEPPADEEVGERVDDDELLGPVLFQGAGEGLQRRARRAALGAEPGEDRVVDLGPVRRDHGIR